MTELKYRKDIRRKLTVDEMDGNFKNLADAIDSLEGRIKALSAKINNADTAEALKSSSGSKTLSNRDSGVPYISEWKNDQQYQKNDLVLFDGCLWYALDSSQGSDPTQSTAWKQIGFKLGGDLDDDDSSMPLALQNNQLLYRDLNKGWHILKSDPIHS